MSAAITKRQAADQRRAERALKFALKPWTPLIGRLQKLAIEEGLQIEVRNPAAPQYQIARITGDGVRLIVYPHTTSNVSHHARVRDENSKDQERAKQVMARIGLWVNNKGVLHHDGHTHTARAGNKADCQGNVICR